MNMTEEEIHAAALSAPDAQPLTEEQLTQMVPFRETEMFKRIQKRAYENKQSRRKDQLYLLPFCGGLC